MESSAHKELLADLTVGAGVVGKSGSGTALHLVSQVAVGKLFCLQVLLLICKRSTGFEILWFEETNPIKEKYYYEKL